MSKNTQAPVAQSGEVPNAKLVRRKDPGKIMPRKDGVPVSWKPFPDLTDAQRDALANEILTRFMNGEQITEMAPDYGVSDRAIYQMLVRDYEEQWRDMQAARALANYERERTALANAKDAVEVSRATALMKSSQWDLEKLLRRLYGDDKAQGQPVQVAVILDFSSTPKARSIDQDE